MSACEWHSATWTSADTNVLTDLSLSNKFSTTLLGHSLGRDWRCIKPGSDLSRKEVRVPSADRRVPYPGLVPLARSSYAAITDRSTGGGVFDKRVNRMRFLLRLEHRRVRAYRLARHRTVQVLSTAIGRGKLIMNNIGNDRLDVHHKSSAPSLTECWKLFMWITKLVFRYGPPPIIES